MIKKEYTTFYIRKNNGNTLGILLTELPMSIQKLGNLHKEFIVDYGEINKYDMNLFIKWLYNKRSIYSELRNPETLWLS